MYTRRYARHSCYKLIRIEQYKVGGLFSLHKKSSKKMFTNIFPVYASFIRLLDF